MRRVIAVSLVVLAGLLGSSLALAKPVPPPLLTVEVVVPSEPHNACFLVAPALGLTDKNTGSPTRALAESFAREAGLIYAQLQRIYESSFVDTATGGTAVVDLVLSVLDRDDPKLVVGQVDARIGPSEGPGRPAMSVKVRDPKQYVAPKVSSCTEVALAGSREKSKDKADNGAR